MSDPKSDGGDLAGQVTGHYSHGRLADVILSSLARLGLSRGRISPDDLAPIDEFHMGGREATVRLAGQLSLPPEAALLDIGSGIGGPARFFAQTFGCRVTGIDLTPEFVAVGGLLNEMTGLAGRVSFEVASATDLPFADQSFDAVTLIHVGMNIPDKTAVAREACRVLKPGGRFLLYEVMRTAPGALPLPMPWASEPAASHVEAPETYREVLRAAGFALEAESDRRDAAKAFFARIREKMASGEPPALSLAQILGEERKAAFPNVIAALEEGLIAPVEMLAAKPA